MFLGMHRDLAPSVVPFRLRHAYLPIGASAGVAARQARAVGLFGDQPSRAEESLATLMLHVGGKVGHAARGLTPSSSPKAPRTNEGAAGRLAGLVVGRLAGHHGDRGGAAVPALWLSRAC